MITRSSTPRYLALAILLTMAGFAAVGFFTIRKDVENLRVITQDNTQWAASQIEIELLRLRLSLAALAADPTPEARDDLHYRFDILWTRVFMDGHVGANLRRHDGEDGPVSRLAVYLKAIDPQQVEIEPADAAKLAEIEATFDGIQADLREFTQRVLRADPTRRTRSASASSPAPAPPPSSAWPRCWSACSRSS